MSGDPQPFQCPKCHKLVKSDQVSIVAHYASPNHDQGLFETPQPAPQQYPQNQPFPQAPQPQYGPPQPQSQQWPYANQPQLPPTRYLGWWAQVKGMWHYYRKGMVYWSLLMIMATIALLTRL